MWLVVFVSSAAWIVGGAATSSPIVGKPVSVLDQQEPLIDERLRILGRMRTAATYDIRVKATSIPDSPTSPMNQQGSLITTSITLRSCDASIVGCFVLRQPASTFLQPGAGRRRTVNEILLAVELSPVDDSGALETVAIEIFKLSGIHRISLYRSEEASVFNDSLSITLTDHLLEWLPTQDEPRFIQVELNKGHLTVKSVTLEVTQTEVNLQAPDEDCESQCALRTHYVNFTENGLSSWILAPSGFFANYCAVSPSQGSFTVPQEGKRCVPTNYRPLRIFYMAGENDYRSQVIPRMSVVTCGCV